MIKHSIFGIRAPRLKYHTILDPQMTPVQVEPGLQVNLMVQITKAQAALVHQKKTRIKKGQYVFEGQLLDIFDDSPVRILSSMTGKVLSVETVTGIYAHQFISIRVEKDQPDTPADETVPLAAPEIWQLIRILPGTPSQDLKKISNNTFDTIVIAGTDNDLFMLSDQYTLLTRMDDLVRGIETLKSQVPGKKIVIVVPEYLKSGVKECGAVIYTSKKHYPGANRRLIQIDVEKKGANGCLFVSAEAVANLGESRRTGTYTCNKLVTVTGRDKKPMLVTAKVGTPVREVLQAAGHELTPADHIIYGGIFTGTSIYSGAIPVMSDTNALIIEPKKEMPRITDCYCINCGDCVRSCPVNIPVNLLIRVIEAEEYEAAVDKLGLFACVECGLCSYVCPAKMPLFQQIKLAASTMKEIIGV